MGIRPVKEVIEPQFVVEGAGVRHKDSMGNSGTFVKA